ncbi:Uncharacterised protein [Mycobacterium tuberculosis]|uniref:Uncharacterized protein n=1 Tax=Mycobacterium tuberculosis TaxID=1773 RepID=A0A916LE24_MYCTX|nr:Uncharacterised protein [Mycobacterium tuberculosis]COZ57609.1 Uncharacterised protein [Mycobacterium tuberculosis]
MLISSPAWWRLIRNRRCAPTTISRVAPLSLMLVPGLLAMRVTRCAQILSWMRLDRHRLCMVGNHPGRQFRMSAMSKRVSLMVPTRAARNLSPSSVMTSPSVG